MAPYYSENRVDSVLAYYDLTSAQLLLNQIAQRQTDHIILLLNNGISAQGFDVIIQDWQILIAFNFGANKSLDS